MLYKNYIFAFFGMNIIALIHNKYQFQLAYFISLLLMMGCFFVYVAINTLLFNPQKKSWFSVGEIFARNLIIPIAICQIIIASILFLHENKIRLPIILHSILGIALMIAPVVSFFYAQRKEMGSKVALSLVFVCYGVAQVIVLGLSQYGYSPVISFFGKLY